MQTNYFDYQETVAKCLMLYMREKGYSRLSLSKLTDVTRSAVDQLLSGWNEDVQEYNTLIEKIRLRFDLPVDYFFKDVVLPQPSPTKLPEVMELKVGLQNILDIYSMYLD